MPNFRFRLPSRNWMIFLTITGSFTGAVIYDRREKRRVQQKWCDLVAHLSREPLAVEETRRKLTVFLEAPPGDSLRMAREYFRGYVKPVLVAAAMDYNIIEGRSEGDVRAALAESIRKSRRQAGEASSVSAEHGMEDIIADARKKIGVHEESGPKGDIVIGRHAWKEYIRGLHEGWLGPLDPPPPPPPAPAPEITPVAENAETSVGDDASPVAGTSEEKATSEDKKKEEQTNENEAKSSKPKGPTPAYIAPADYSSQNIPKTIPQSFQGSVPIPFPHILGFFNTPIRIYRYLTQRYLADSVGREVAAIVLSSSSRPYRDGPFSDASDPAAGTGIDNAPTVSPADGLATELSSSNYEQQHALEHEEQDWHKSVHKRSEGADSNEERDWLDDIVMDPRIASRMRRSTMSPEDESRSERIGEGKEYVLGLERPPHVSLWKRVWIKCGLGEDEETLRKKPIIGNLDGEDGQ